MRRFVGLSFSAVLLCFEAGSASAVTTLVAFGSEWRYLDNGSNQGTAWSGTGFPDSSWQSGPAQLGYGDFDEATVVGYGGNPSAKYTTTYFRRSFAVSGAAGFARADLRLLRDDGAVVYLNGTEVFRSNLPAGTILSSTLASTAIGGSDELTLHSASIDPALFVDGTNLLAVEIHQSGPTSSDISFDLELTASPETAAVVRGPYLQMASPSSMTVRWRTDLPTPGVVRFGTTLAALDQQASGATATEHVVTLTDLEPDTLYYYSVGSFAATLAGGDANHFFRTSPEPGSRSATRIWVLGDSGTANVGARAVRDAYLAYTGSHGQDLLLMLGDNAYSDGTDAEFQAAVFDTYPTVLRNTPLWPTLGNHDGHTADSATESGPYYSIFTLPRQGEIGGVASFTEAYYSFDVANIHFVCLDSYETSRAHDGAMASWLEDDLAATTADWTIAFWHHPPYSKGSHDSDVDVEMIQMRENFLPILDSYGVDLVLTGHSHSYERSVLLDGHYDLSATFDASMAIDAGDGSPEGDGPYQKPTLGPAAHEGTVYAVAGSSGQVASATGIHPAMVVSLVELGSMVLDVEGGSLDAVFLTSTGAVHDHFRIEKPLPPGPIFFDDFEGGDYCDWSDAEGGAGCA